MTEETHPDDDSYIVRVKAVVMTRDDSSGGWLAQDGGCLSRVGVCKVLSAELLGRSSFLIHGERLKDKQVILECFLKKDLVYTKATPTFHHWKVDNKKCGLTFQSPADARAFDRGVRKAMEDLTEGSTTSSSTIQNEAELGDDDVFTNATDSSSNSSHSQKKEPPQLQTLAPPSFCEPRLHHCILGHFYDQHRPSDHYFLDQVGGWGTTVAKSVPMFPRPRQLPGGGGGDRANRPRGRTWLTGVRGLPARHRARDKLIQHPGDTGASCTSPSAAAQHARDPKIGCMERLGGGRPCGGHRAVVQPSPAPSSSRASGGRKAAALALRLLPGHVQPRGEQAWGAAGGADPIQTCIHRVSFMWCADSLLYHCMSDPEGDYSDPCSCDTSDERFCLRWLALVGLSLLAPCMCCYAPLRACYRCGVACHCCGGKHKAVG
ncbi:sprouty-related, EVH1 domain-containing protein 2-like [Coregonus clupeaformis]|uniref:sprouty-related, EVH1 domain-containing protein 2-like n=1 Tax=Coregonus clupeaformis TaxID=59861 RepID=UPI001E1C610C|nr:sprouty-related, EVH1 domain-containing protein 2-like [Coregonus clupeaformis]